MAIADIFLEQNAKAAQDQIDELKSRLNLATANYQTMCENYRRQGEELKQWKAEVKLACRNLEDSEKEVQELRRRLVKI